MRMIRYFTGVILGFLSSASMAGPSVEIKISAASSKQDAEVHVAATNVGDHVVFLLTSQTPFGLVEGRLQGSWFEITDEDGRRVDYRGRQVLVRDPGPSAFVQLVPGETIEADVNLAEDYALPASGAILVGTRIVAYRGLPRMGALGDSVLAPGEEIVSDRVAVSVGDGILSPPIVRGPMPCQGHDAVDSGANYEYYIMNVPLGF